jgi:hypothetical protein
MLKSVVASSLPIRKDYPFYWGNVTQVTGVGSIIERKSYTVMRKGRVSFSVVFTPRFIHLYPRFSSSHKYAPSLSTNPFRLSLLSPIHLCWAPVLRTCGLSTAIPLRTERIVSVFDFIVY